PDPAAERQSPPRAQGFRQRRNLPVPPSGNRCLPPMLPVAGKQILREPARSEPSRASVCAPRAWCSARPLAAQTLLSTKLLLSFLKLQSTLLPAPLHAGRVPHNVHGRPRDDRSGASSFSFSVGEEHKP